MSMNSKQNIKLPEIQTQVVGLEELKIPEQIINLNEALREASQNDEIKESNWN